MKSKKILKYLVLFLVVIGVEIVGMKVYVSYLKNNVDITMVPSLTMEMNGENLLLHEVSWQVPYFFGSKKEKVHMTYDNETPNINIIDQTITTAIAPITGDATFTIFDENKQPIFDGDEETLSGFVFEQNGTYLLSAHLAASVSEKGHGDAYFSTQLTVDIPRPLTHHIATTTLVQGEGTAITLDNVPVGILPVGTSDIGHVHFATTDMENQYKAIVAIGYSKPPAIYPITIQVGEEVISYEVEVVKGDFEVQNLQISSETTGNTIYSDKANAEYREKIWSLYDTANDEIYWDGPFVQPATGRVSSPYGIIRYINDDPTPQRHGGVDFAIPLGTPLIAPNHGKIELAEFLQLTGNTIVIEHGGGLKTHIYHMDSLSVNTGDMVTKGDLLGTVGTTGFSTGPHLHYEIKMGNQSINPWPFFDGTTSIMQ